MFTALKNKIMGQSPSPKPVKKNEAPKSIEDGREYKLVPNDHNQINFENNFLFT